MHEGEELGGKEGEVRRGGGALLEELRQVRGGRLAARVPEPRQGQHRRQVPLEEIVEVLRTGDRVLVAARPVHGMQRLGAV